MFILKHCLKPLQTQVTLVYSGHSVYKMSLNESSQANGSCYLIVRYLCVALSFWYFCCISVFLFFGCFPLIVDVFTSVLVCNSDLFSLNRFMTFEQRYTTVALIHEPKGWIVLTFITSEFDNVRLQHLLLVILLLHHQLNLKHVDFFLNKEHVIHLHV